MEGVRMGRGRMPRPHRTGPDPAPRSNRRWLREDLLMNRMMIALAAAALATAGTARADWGGVGAPAGAQGGVHPIADEFNAPNTLMGFGAGQPGHEPGRYGLLPGLRRTIRLGGDGRHQPSR